MPIAFKSNAEREAHHRAFVCACADGDLAKAESLYGDLSAWWLFGLTASNEQKAMINNSDHLPFCMACANGRKATIEWLYDLASPDEKKAMIKADSHSAFRSACKNGHLAIAQWLFKLAPADEQKEMIRACSYDAFSGACTHGHQATAQWLYSVASVNDQKGMIKYDNYAACRWACGNGHQATAQWLYDLISSSEQKAMIEAHNYMMFQQTCRNGHQATARWLYDLVSPDEQKAMIEARSYRAFESACSGGHQATAQWLYDLVSADEQKAMIKANRYGAYRSACIGSHQATIEWLFDKSLDCFAYAEQHVHEYGRSVQPFIAKELTVLQATKQATEAASPNTVFNIEDTDKAKLCFYILRHIIRRNDRADDDNMRFLLNLPAVKALAHQCIDEHSQENGLLRLGMAQNNQTAIALLLQIPAVRELAEENNFYVTEARSGVDISTLARNAESSMTALTQGEQKRLKAATDHYKPLLARTGINNIIKDLRQCLIARYEKNPATITVGEQTIVLPLKYDDFIQLNLSEEDIAAANKAYYQHDDHSALRYLSKPNRWMHPQASYVYVDPANPADRYATFEDYQPLISLCYVGAADKQTKPIDGHTLESRLTLFIKELALIGRAHNWDRSRLNADGKDEEYDDLEADRPSCFSGVKRRLFQSVLGHPLFSVISKDAIFEELRDFVQTHIKAKLTDDNHACYKQAYEDVAIMLDEDPEHLAMLKKLDLSDKQIEAFVAAMQEKYGEDFAPFRPLVQSKLSITPDQAHAITLDGIAKIGELLGQPAKAIKVSGQSVFSSSATPSSSTTTTSICPPRPGGREDKG